MVPGGQNFECCGKSIFAYCTHYISIHIIYIYYVYLNLFILQNIYIYIFVFLSDMFQCFENHNFLSPLFPFPSTQTVHPAVQERRDARERRQQQHTERLEAKRVELVTKERQKWQRGISVALGCEL